MNKYLQPDEWCIVEKGFNPENHRSSESIFSLGNGRMGQRANFEEKYSGKTLQGTYIGGVYYTDKTRVGWWKNGYPEYFAKVLNAPNWTAIPVVIDGEELDLAVCRVSDFVRTLNMKEGYLERSFKVVMRNGHEVAVRICRFISMAEKEAAFIQYSVTPLNFSGEIVFTPAIDGDVKNEDANYDEQFWEVPATDSDKGWAYLHAVTRKTNFHVSMGMRYTVNAAYSAEVVREDKYVANRVKVLAEKGQETVLRKYVAVLSSLNHDPEHLYRDTVSLLDKITASGFEKEFNAHKQVWQQIWEYSDIVIRGDVEAQQGIRFNIFQLKQTYTGDDARLNIGPKGFTGEKYGGSTYWDTEAYCVPFCLATSSSEVTRNLLIYRYKQLDKAIENGEKLGFNAGAALYPMVTMNGEECHNEWEITFEEIHRNGAIAYAIYNYVNYTGDTAYIAEYGLPVLVGIARFWAQRATWSQARQKYVILGVTGPNEYENNVNNNWYTNKIAAWCMSYAATCLDEMERLEPERYAAWVRELKLNEPHESDQWKEVVRLMYFPEDPELGIFLQQDGYLDKEQMLAADLDPACRPINQHWSWDRILRSCFIKQADVLQGLFFFEQEYDLETILRNFEFYESRTVHESSLSPCVHSILAAKLGDLDKAYCLYLRTARLDLDDYNKEAHEGLHITSMAGTWMSIVQGFGGMRVKDGVPYFRPIIPEAWTSYSFKVFFRGQMLKIDVEHDKVAVTNESDKVIVVQLFGEKKNIASGATVTVN